MWDDEGSGFYMWLNWDWGSNCPEQMGADDERKCGVRTPSKHLLRPE